MKYYYLVSGGKDSTAMVLDAIDKGMTGELVFGDTRLNRSAPRATIKRLAEYSGWPLHTVRYDGEVPAFQVLKESFRAIPEAFAWQKKYGTFGRNMFKCCKILKHDPMKKWQKLHPKDESCFVLGLKGSDGSLQRHYRMRELREQNTFYRRIKRNGMLYYYPLRDFTDRMVDEKLKAHGFQDTKGSGCFICPIFCLFEGMRKKDPDTWRRSVQMADRLGIEHPASGQQFFPCTAIGEMWRKET